MNVAVDQARNQAASLAIDHHGIERPGSAGERTLGSPWIADEQADAERERYGFMRVLLAGCCGSASRLRG